MNIEMDRRSDVNDQTFEAKDADGELRNTASIPRACRCGTDCGFPVHLGRWYAHNCPARRAHRCAVKRAYNQQYNATQRKTRSTGRKQGRPPGPQDISEAEIEQRFQAHKAYLKACRQQGKAAA